MNKLRMSATLAYALALLSTANAGTIELTCDTSLASAISNSTKWQAEARVLCDKGDSKACARAETIGGHIAKCSEPGVEFGSRYVFSLDESVLSGNQLAFAEFYTQGCPGGRSGLLRASVTSTPSVITFKIKYPDLEQPIYFNVNRENLQVNTGSNVYQCAVRKSAAQNKL